MKELQRTGGLAARRAHKILGTKDTPKVDFSKNHVADDDLESSDSFTWHMQSGQGNEYIESFGLLSSIPLESL